MGLKLIPVFVFAATILASGKSAEACVCSAVSGEQQIVARLKDFDTILQGTVEAITLGYRPWPTVANLPPELLGTSQPIHVVTLKDVKAWRGRLETTVVTRAITSSCGYFFHVGRNYLITARRQDGELLVTFCGFTRFSEDAGEILEYIKRLPPF